MWIYKYNAMRSRADSRLPFSVGRHRFSQHLPVTATFQGHSSKMSAMACIGRPTVAAGFSRRSAVRVQAASWNRVSTKDALQAAGGKLVVDVGGKKVLVAELNGEVLAVSNKCTHLNLPLVGKTAIFQGKISNNCIVCPAHNTAFDLRTGEVVGEWCPTFPTLPLVGKGTKPTPLPTFKARVSEDGGIEVYG